MIQVASPVQVKTDGGNTSAFELAQDTERAPRPARQQATRLAPRCQGCAPQDHLGAPGLGNHANGWRAGVKASEPAIGGYGPIARLLQPISPTQEKFLTIR